jgi:hypothetical protein
MWFGSAGSTATAKAAVTKRPSLATNQCAP